MCIEKLELSTLEHGLTLEILYPIGYALMGAMINYVGKLALLGMFSSIISKNELMISSCRRRE